MADGLVVAGIGQIPSIFESSDRLKDQMFNMQQGVSGFQ